jgi:alkanesulfonate monooxygenase SsuD/methylene tetrahydromethanopterin reductase-like flavin-dependent oxidoreductase (luciferase family)
MRNDTSRQWAMLTPLGPGEVLTAQAQQAEAAGLAGIFVPEIYSSPFMSLGYCAAVTERVQLASGILNAFASSPFEIAMTAMDLDRVSGGRLVLGLGTSIRAWSEGPYGMPGYGKPVAHIRETIDVIRLVIAKSHTGELDRYDGAYHRHDWSTFLGPFAPPVRSGCRSGLPATSGPDAPDAPGGRALRGVHRPPDPRDQVDAEPGAQRVSGGAPHRRQGPQGHPLERLAVGGGQLRPGRGPRRRAHDRRVLRGHATVRADVRRDGVREGGAGLLEAFERKDMAGWVGAVSDDMAQTFVVLGGADACRRRVAEVWDLADSFCLVPPLGGLPPEKICSTPAASPRPSTPELRPGRAIRARPGPG